MLKIRLMRIGAKKKPFYRVVVVDERAKRTGAYIELLGTYNPLTEPKEIKLKKDRIEHWVKQGAQLSNGYLRIIGKAPQRPPRKPKKEHKQATADSGQVKQEEPESQKTEEPKLETETKPDSTEIPQAVQEEKPVEEVTEAEAKPESVEKEDAVDGSTSSPQTDELPTDAKDK